MLVAGGDHSISRESLFVKSVKVKRKSRSAPNSAKVSPSKSSDLRGWPAIAQFLGMPHSTMYRWAKEGMPVRREGRNVIASPDELSQWLQRTSEEAAGVHVVTPGSDLLKDLRASVAAQKGSKSSPRDPKNERAQRPVMKVRKAKRKS
jgi:predicted DNA-binding transcriptional regulator AlpA